MYCTNKEYQCIDDWISNKYILNPKSSFRILQLNVRGMNELSKFDVIKETLQRYGEKVDVLVLGETWVKADRVCLYAIAGYRSVFSCRNDSHGGLAVFVRNELQMDVCRNIVIEGFHHIHCRFKFEANAINLHAVYRPPSFDVRRFLHEIEGMISLSKNNEKCVLVGDLNIPLNITTNNIVGEYIRLLETYNMLPTNTVVSRQSSNNILDHVVCSTSMIEDVFNETIFTDVSDHCLICSSINMKCHTSESTLHKRIIDHSRLNELFERSILNIPQNLSVNERLNYVITHYNEILNDCSRLVTQRVKLKGSCPWMTLDLWKLIKIKDKLLKKKRNNPNDNHTTELFAHVSKILQDKKAKTKRDYYEGLLSGNNQKAAWKIIKNVMGNQKSNSKPTAIRNGAQLITDPQQVCSSFNDHFCAIGPKLSSTINTNRNINRFGTLGSLQSTIFLNPFQETRSYY